MEKVSIIGSGNVGANTAFFIAEKGITSVVLHDVKEGLSTGKALDMMEAAPLRKYRNRIRGIDDISGIKNSETVIIAAGRGRTPGMKREDLAAENWAIIKEITEQVLKHSPDSIIIVATEPVDILTTLVVKEFTLDRTSVLGLGGILDATRLKYAISRKLNISTENITAMVMGRHSDDMIPVPEYTRISGIPLDQMMSGEEIKKLENEIKDVGNLIVEMAERSSAYYTPSAAAAEVVDSIHMDLKRILPVSVMLDGEYGITGSAMSIPCVVGKKGAERFLEPKLSKDQLDRLKASGRAIQDIIKGLKL